MNRANALTYNREMINNRAVNAAIGVLFFILATTLGAYVRIPLKGNPVPITLQTFFVILSGAVLGRRLGGLSQLGYVVLGAVNFPIFQSFAFGLPYLLGPTGGYLIGFVFAAYFIGWMLESNSSARRITASFIMGSLIIYAFGILWLLCLYKMSIMRSVSMGILPFIPGDIVKVIFASIIYSKISKRTKNIFSL